MYWEQRVGMPVGSSASSIGMVWRTMGWWRAGSASAWSRHRRCSGLVLGATKVYLSHKAFHRFEDVLRAAERRVRRKRWCTATGPGRTSTHPMRHRRCSRGVKRLGVATATAVPHHTTTIFIYTYKRRLDARRSPFQHTELYKRDDDASRYTSAWDGDEERETASNFGSESYEPSRNMFGTEGKGGKASTGGAPLRMLDKDVLAAEIAEGETTEVYKESSAEAAWHEKLALNMLIWFTCLCTVFIMIIVFLGRCPMKHVFSQSELASHNFANNANNAFTSIRGEVFDLNTIVSLHDRTLASPCSMTPIPARSTTTSTSSPATRAPTRRGFIGITPKEICTRANNGSSIGIYNGLVYDLTSYV
ncbi:hypothetical protein DFH08DRAFT_1018402 [Mycena albidolilacea]|uniref:Uncharacterized protein n=1 Tax=Mycena albidolilacea TaxID=1033008 RepID=A0AAD7EKZ4_9AGAR|nr:hypothetical protein DFH08DRAFT_1018402 [Mycena albidolilacea]